MKFTIRQIEVFLETARHENITAAASALAMSQSAASESLKALENQFDTQLFDRTGKRLQLNDHGRILRAEAQAFIEKGEEVQALLQKKQQLGDLKVGATLTIGNYIVSDLIALYQTAFPLARVELDIANTHSIATRLANFDLDLALIEGEITHPQLDVDVWMRDEMSIFCSPENPLAQKGIVSEADLVKANWVLREQGSGTRQAFDLAMQGLIHQLNITLELQQTEAIKQAVKTNLGIGCLSNIALQNDFQQQTLAPLKLEKRRLQRHFYIVRHRDRKISPSVESWLSLCHRYADRVAENEPGPINV